MAQRASKCCRAPGTEGIVGQYQFREQGHVLQCRRENARILVVHVTVGHAQLGEVTVVRQRCRDGARGLIRTLDFEGRQPVQHAERSRYHAPPTVA